MMGEADEGYGLLSETSGIAETRDPARQQHLKARTAAEWLAAGWRDMLFRPQLSLAYGLGVFALSALVVWAMRRLGWDDVLFPALAGFLVVGPMLAIGLYEKSRRREKGHRITLGRMLFVRARSGKQVFFVGALLCLLMLLWMRSAVLIYALFFGYRPFPGFDAVAALLATSPRGWAMLATGGLVGGLFAAFGFAVGALSVPMLLAERTDAVTAMGRSMAIVWNNLPVMVAWGAIVLALFLASLATGLLGLVVVFPLLGHATWHAYRALR